ncbi:MAG: hypothetical protein LBS93_05200 [Synergistaceae bacterium]|jgi:hypothetical protein|nr:hypothetical protein [Synergistaceae bacterium]
MSRADLERQNTADMEHILKQPEGARLIAGLIDYCGLFDESSAASREARDVGLMLYRYALSIRGGEDAYIRGRNMSRNILEKKEEGDGNG